MPVLTFNEYMRPVLRCLDATESAHLGEIRSSVLGSTGWTRYQKLEWLAEAVDYEAVEWQSLEPDRRHNWLGQEGAQEWETYIPVGSKETKASRAAEDVDAIFKTFSLGMSTNRDDTAYGFSADEVETKAQRFIETYGDEVARYERRGRPTDLDAFLDPPKLKWSRNLAR